MGRDEFIFICALALIFAFCLGWVCSYFLHRFMRRYGVETQEMADFITQLRGQLKEQNAQLSEIHMKERRLSKLLAEKEAESAAAMEGLRSARIRNDELQSLLDKNSTQS